MLIYSVNSHRKIAHLPHCQILRRIPRENRRTFDSLEDARTHGYRLCNCCPSIAQKYRKERIQVNAFCKSHGFTLKLHNGVIHIISRRDCWRIIVYGKKKSLFLYHRNNRRHYCTGGRRSIVPGFHCQACRSKSILKYLEYINSHDYYRDDHPWTEKTSVVMDRRCNVPEWVIDKYGDHYSAFSFSKSQRTKGTKRYRKEQAKKKQQKRRADIIRVYALIEELSTIGS